MRRPQETTVFDMPEATPNGGVELEVVICTFDNAPMLDRVLSALGAQRPPVGAWSVLVVDNNSTDATPAVVDRHVGLGAVPGLRRVVEPEQGLTHARLRGVRATTAGWIAFVDDDCILDPHWVERALAFARSEPDCGGFGGRVVPTYTEPPPAVLATYGWAFAEQDLGDATVPVDCLVGAGMVLSRSALVESGWVDGPLFADRVGRRLISGGDVEIALRLAGTGRPLWYVPGCELAHIIPARRTTLPYLRRIVLGLGVSASMASALTWRGSPRSWARAMARELATSAVSVLRTAKRARTGPDARHDAVLAASYETGHWLGAARVALQLATGRCEFFGRAAGGVAASSERWDDAVRAA